MINIKQLVPGTQGQTPKVSASTGKLAYENECGYYVAANRFGFGGTIGDHTEALRAIELQISATTAFTAAADTSGKTAYLRTQNGGTHTSNNPNGGDLIVLLGAPGGGFGRPGYFNVTRSTCGDRCTVIGWIAGLAMTGEDNILYGASAGSGITTGNRNTCIGSSSGGGTGNGDDNTCIGYMAQAGSGNAGTVVVGASSTADSSDVVIGYGASASGASGSIVLGRGTANSVSGCFTAGCDTYPITNIYFGNGRVSTSAAAYTINGTGGSGTNNAGANVIIAGGKGTGNAAGGSFIFQTAPRGASGPGQNTLGTRFQGDQYGLITHSPAAAMNLAGDVSGVVAPEWTLTAAAHGASPGPGIAASTERRDVHWNLTREVRWATGNITLQRNVFISGPAYSFVGASVITTATTLYVDVPTPSTNCTITNAYSIYATGSIYTAANVHITATPAVTSGTVVTLTARTGIAFSLGEVGYIYSDGTVDKAKADAAATAPVAVICAEAGGISSGGSGKFLLAGIIVNAGWSWATLGGPIYLSAATAGALTQTQPAATDNVIQVIGWALSATKILFKASSDMMTHT